MSSSSSHTPRKAGVVSANAADDAVTNAIANVLAQLQRAHTDSAIERVRNIILNMPNPTANTQLCRDRNTVPKEEYNKYAAQDTVVVTTYEVGKCSACDQVGPCTFFCSCGGVYTSHLEGVVVPEHIVRFPNIYFDDESTKEEWKRPETLKNIVACAMRVKAIEWMGNQEDYPASCIEELIQTDTPNYDDLLLIAERSLQKFHKELSEMYADDINFINEKIDQEEIGDMITAAKRKAKKRKKAKKRQKANKRQKCKDDK